MAKKVLEDLAVRFHVAGVDVHRDVLAITVISQATTGELPVVETFSCGTFTSDLEQAGQRLKDLGVEHIAMESTGIYWIPVYNVWRQFGFTITIGNAAHMKNVPGRKTDEKDSEWIARLHRNGMIRPSHLPEEELKEVRDLSRHRESLTRDLTQVKNRTHKILESANIKLGSVLNDIFGVAGRAVLQKIANGITDAKELAKAVDTNVRAKRGEVERSLQNTLKKNDCFIISDLLAHAKFIEDAIERISREITSKMAAHKVFIEKLDEIPGISRKGAEDIIAEIGGNLTDFRDEKAFAAWAGVAPGNNESAGKKKRARSRKGNPYLKRLLIQAAQGATKKKGSYYQAKFNKLKSRLGSINKAKVAIANKIARVIFKLLSGDINSFRDLGADQVAPRELLVKKLTKKLQSLGYTVSLSEKDSEPATSTIKSDVAA